MYYDCKLIKPIPGYPIGYEFGIYENPKDGTIGIREAQENRHWLRPTHPLVEAYVFDEGFVEKHVSEQGFRNIACPSCGGTVVHIYDGKVSISHNDGVDYHYKEILAECKCGNKYFVCKVLTRSRCT